MLDGNSDEIKKQQKDVDGVPPDFEIGSSYGLGGPYRFGLEFSPDPDHDDHRGAFVLQVKVNVSL